MFQKCFFSDQKSENEFNFIPSYAAIKVAWYQDYMNDNSRVYLISDNTVQIYNSYETLLAYYNLQQCLIKVKILLQSDVYCYMFLVERWLLDISETETMSS